MSILSVSLNVRAIPKFGKSAIAHLSKLTKNIMAYSGVGSQSGRSDAIAIVGYSADRFIIRNSWGSDWGDRGYAYASDAYAEAAFDEAYDISV